MSNYGVLMREVMRSRGFQSLVMFILGVAALHTFNVTTTENDNQVRVENLLHSETKYDIRTQITAAVEKLNVDLMEKKQVKTYPPVNRLPTWQKKRILVTGGAGFVGSNLVDLLMEQGHEVLVIDNFFTGRKDNIRHWIDHPNFELRNRDVCEPLYVEVDRVYHLASPASPPHYMYNPIKTIKTNVEGTQNMLGLARRVKARVLFTSTSEVYGDPKEHPQRETYWGNVNPIGPRACYDEAKRLGETMMYAYQKQAGVDVRVVRIFNTFGPRMHPNDGRVVSNFIIQALQNQTITIYGTGDQTRSFQFVDDLVRGINAVMEGPVTTPVNLGNPEEFTILEFAKLIIELTGSRSEIKFLPKSKDDPSRRKPDISKAKKNLNWQPRISVRAGLMKTIEYFRQQLEANGGSLVTVGQAPQKPGFAKQRN
eukprot:CAMPEP_0184492138 /NCGR_PEP_ID=MMETSP0113_2-20130426/22400_1 /TAXON_ID=91329 /ORGANISM="Norrisiella sphaerica, Strain BC52" /LENGTH=424 /DNA_ID=CAMNT_0026876793 /DNA_START=208 /DNA_END=1482 /DNA_ORIENTATION=-